MITKVNFQPLTNPSRNPHIKVVKRWIKIATWSAIASLILLTSLEKKNTTKTNTRLASISFVCVADVGHVWVNCFSLEKAVPHPYSFHQHPFQRPLGYSEKTWCFSNGRRLLCINTAEKILSFPRKSRPASRLIH